MISWIHFLCSTSTGLCELNSMGHFNCPGAGSLNLIFYYKLLSIHHFQIVCSCIHASSDQLPSMNKIIEQREQLFTAWIWSYHVCVLPQQLTPSRFPVASSSLHLHSESHLLGPLCLPFVCQLEAEPAWFFEGNPSKPVCLLPTETPFLRMTTCRCQRSARRTLESELQSGPIYSTNGGLERTALQPTPPAGTWPLARVTASDLPRPVSMATPCVWFPEEP